MDSMHTMLLYRTPEHVTTVPADAYVVRLNTANHQLQEFRSGAAVPEGGAGLHLYTVPLRPLEPVFAMQGAISCSLQNDASFRPGFCFGFTMRYISPAGLKGLLTASTARNGYIPDCVTLEDLYNLLLPQMKAACEAAVARFTGGKVLSYTHWWQEMNSGTAFAKALSLALIPVLNSFGFRLEPDSLVFKGLASRPLA